MTGTTSVSTCRPAYCFRRTWGKSVLGTKVLGNAVLEHTTNFVWPVVQQVLFIYLFFIYTMFKEGDTVSSYGQSTMWPSKHIK